LYYNEVSQEVSITKVKIAKLTATYVRTVTGSRVITTISCGRTLITAEPDTTEPFSALHQGIDSPCTWPSDRSCCCLRESERPNLARVRASV